MNYTTFGRSLHLKDFRRLWIYIVCQAIAMSMNYMTIGWLAFETTNSALMTTLAYTMHTAPFLLFSPLAGIIIDKYNRVILLRIILTTLTVITGIMGVISLNFGPQYWQILIYCALYGCGGVFLFAIRNTLSYDITGKELALNGLALNSVGTQIGLIFGPLLSGLVLSSFGAEINFFIISIVTLISMVFSLLISIRVHKNITYPQKSIRVFFNEVWNIVRDTKAVLMLLITATLTELFGFSTLSLMPIIAKEVLGLGSWGLGVVIATRQVACILGQALLARNSDYRHRGTLILLIMGCIGLCLMSLILSRNLFYYVSFLSLTSAFAWGVESLNSTLIQDNVSENHRGKATGLWGLSIGIGPVAYLSLGSLVGLIGIQLTLFVSGSAMLLSTIILAFSSRTIRQLK